MPEAPAAVSSVYVASPEGDTGKSTIALGVLQMLCATVARVGVFRPIARSTEETDYILELLLEHTTADLSYADALGVTYEQVHADPEAALADIVAKYHTVAEQCDAVVIIGSDYTDVASPSELSFNARIAVNLARRFCWRYAALGAVSRRSPSSRICVPPSWPPTTLICSPSSPIVAIPTSSTRSPQRCPTSVFRRGACRRFRCSSHPRWPS